MIGCEPVNEPTTEEGGTTTVDDSNIASVNKVTNYYGTIYEVILKDGNRMYFGIKNDSEVRMGKWSYFYDGSEYEYEKYAEYEYKGHLVIPEKITLEGKEYTVTELYDMSHADIGYYVANTTLLSVVVPNTIKKITSRCFEACTALKSVKFEKGSPIQELVGCCFKGCSSLEEVILPDNLSFIGTESWGETFALCTSLKTINLPKTVTKIQDRTFLECTALENINLENVKVIGKGTFTGCTSLENVDLDKLEVLGVNTFNGCTSLKKVELPNANKIMDNAFHGCISLEDVKLDNLEVLGVNAFDSCTSLKQIELPSIKYLGVAVDEEKDKMWWGSGDAFNDCHSLETVVLGSSLLSTNSGDLFNGCNNMNDVYCYAVNPPMDTDWEEGDTDYRTILGDFVLHVPASSIESYKETNWGAIAYYVESWLVQWDWERTIVAIEE